MRKRIISVCCFSIFTLLSVAVGVRAEEAQKLPQVDVQAERIGESNPYTSPVVSEIDPETQIPAGQISDLTDLMKLSNSIYIQDTSYGKALFLRGLTEQDLRIMINGVPVGQMGRYYSRSFAWEAIPLENIERIEVVRGAGSVEYGNTLTGTVNIITKKGGKDIKTTAKTSYGTFDDFKAQATNSGSKGSLDWFVGAGYRSRGEYLRNNDIDEHNFSGSVGWRFSSDSELRVTGFSLKRKEGLVLDSRVNWNVWSDSADYASGSKFNLETDTLMVTYKSSWLDLSASNVWQKRDDDYKKDSWSAGDTYDYDIKYTMPTFQGKLHHSFGAHKLKLGAEYSMGEADANFVYYEEGTEQINWKQELAGAFLEDSWQILPALNFTLGLRYDHYKNEVESHGADQPSDTSISDQGFSPRASLTYDLPKNWQVFAFAGRVFKAPTMADMYRWYGNYNLISFAGRAVLRAYYGLNQPPGAPASIIPQQYIDGWRDLIGQLEPTTGWDYELGTRVKGKNHALQVNFFYQDLENYVTIYPVSYPPTYNVDAVKLWGVEFTGIYTFNRYLEAEAVYTWLKNKVEGDEIVKKLYGRDELFNAPDHILNLTLRSRPLDGLLLEWQSQFVSSRFAGGAPAVPPQAAKANPQYQPMYDLGSYWLHNVRASYTTKLGPTETTFSLAVENIFNEKDYIRLDYPLPGTLVYGGVSFTF
jgi:outer membrane receptor protein involved in Fe transport